MAQLIMAKGAAPATPSTGKAAVYVDTNGRLSMVDDTGLVLPGGIVTSGVWTPTLGASSVAGTHTYTTQLGRYVKVGRLVVLHFRIQINTKDGAMSGSVQVQGLPFTVITATGLNMPGSISFWSALATASTWVGIYTFSNTTTAPITHTVAAVAAASNMVDTAIQNGTRLDGMLMYEAAS